MRTYRLFTLLGAALLATAAMAATNYNINVGGVEVTSSNAGNVTGGDIKFKNTSGYVSYSSSTNTLTLKDVKIERGGSNDRAVHNRGCDNLTIKILGSCEFTGSGCSTFKLERSTTLVVPEGNTCSIKCTSSGDDAIWVTRDANTTLTVTGGGNIYLTSTKGEGIAGSSKDKEKVVISARQLYIDANRGAFCDLKSVQFTPDAALGGTARGITTHLMVKIQPTGSSSYAHARNVGSISASGNVTVKAPTFNGSVTMLSTSSNYNLTFIISDETEAATVTRIGNFLYNKTPVTLNGESVAQLAGPTLSYSYSYPTEITVPGYVILSGAYRPVSIGVAAFRNMSWLQIAHLQYGVRAIGDNAFIYCDLFRTIYIPGSVHTMGHLIFAFTDLNSVFWSNLAPDKVSMDTSSFATNRSARANVFLPTIAAREKASSTAAATYHNLSVNSTYCYDFAVGSARYVVTKTADTGSKNGEMALTGFDGAAVSVTSTNGQYTHSASVGGNGGTYDCTSVAPMAFKNNKTITGINLSQSTITTIGDEAFSGANAVKSLTIGEGVTTIGSEAFYNCSAIQTGVWNAVWYSGFTTSSPSPFYSARNTLSSLTFGSKVRHIPAYLCWGNHYVKSISIPNSVTSIGDRAFAYAGLTALTIPNTVTSVGTYAFNGCPLTSLTIGTGLTTIAEGVFSSTTMTTVTIPNTVTEIDKYAFSTCQLLTSVNLGTQLKTLGESAFSYCTSLRSVTLPDKLSRIRDGVFSDCSALETFTTGTGLTWIGNEVFKGCTALKTINWNATNPYLSGTSSPFSDVSGGITTFTFGENVTSIPAHLCYGMKALKTLTLHEKINKINDYALNCENLQRIDSWNWRPPTTGAGVFNGVNKQTCELHVPWNSLSSYENADTWKDFYNIINDLGEPEYSKFDVNHDLHVDVGDVNAVLEAILNNDKSAIYDVNDDNNVDVGDVNAILEDILTQ